MPSREIIPSPPSGGRGEEGVVVSTRIFMNQSFMDFGPFTNYEEDVGRASRPPVYAAQARRLRHQESFFKRVPYGLWRTYEL
jgi:hypothetical protein